MMGYRGYLTTAIFVIACWLSCHASPVEVPQPEAIENTFSLYAYGENISGLMLLYVDGNSHSPCHDQCSQIKSADAYAS